MGAKQELQLQNRIWELDALRGLMVLCILAWHLYFTVDAFCINGYYAQLDSYAYVNATDPLHFWFDWGADGVIYANFDFFGLQDIAIHLGVDTFFIISGISCLLSRNNLRRSLIMLAAAYAVSLFTFCMSRLSDGSYCYIRFGVLQCYAYCRLLYIYVFEKRSNRTLAVCAVLSLALGYALRAAPAVDTPLLYPFGVAEIGVVASDWWPIFPQLGWLLLGVLLGRTVYRERRSLIRGRWQGQGTRWLQALGRYSGQIYFFHIFVYTAVFLGIGWLLKLF